jgi:hypothetical protein
MGGGMSDPVLSRTPSEAVDRFQSALQRFVSCVTRGVLTVGGGYAPSSQTHTITFPDNRLERMAGESELGLRLKADYQIGFHGTPDRRRGWTVAIIGYQYSIETLHESEMIAWHLHSNTPHTISRPHLHLGPAAEISREELHRAHIPTGIVTVADIVRCAIAEFHVEPRRDDWQAILDFALNTG